MKTFLVAAIFVGLDAVLLLGVGIAGGRAEGADAARHKVYGGWPFDAKEARRRQEETAKALGIPVEKAIALGGGVKLDLVLLPAGELMMGSGASPEEVMRKSKFVEPGEREPALAWFRIEHPQHRVRITKPFYIGRCEVTQEQWERVMGTNPGEPKGPRNPIQSVTWDDCQKFMEKLNSLVKERGRFGLPTEAEWEYACRAGTATPFHTGETIATDQANFNGKRPYGGGRAGQYRQRILPVGTLAANAFGLYDMHGNVYEWCQDWFKEDYYKDSPKDDPAGPASDPRRRRVVRGGQWTIGAHVCRSAFRWYESQSDRSQEIGLRVVLRDL